MLLVLFCIEKTSTAPISHTICKFERRNFRNMRKALLIAEKSSLMNEIKAAYNAHKSEFDYDIKFMAQAGHLVRVLNPTEMNEDLKSWKWDTLPFHPEQMGGWQYCVIKGKEKKYSEIATEIKSNKYDFIIHAGDPDQEGELLVNLVLNMAKNKAKVMRFWSNDLTEGAIVKALKGMTDDKTTPLYANMNNAAIGRQHSDYRIGMNGSRSASLKMGTCALGRVKAVILAINAKRENEIRNFKPETSYAIKVIYKEGFSGMLFDDLIKTEESENQDSSEIRFKTQKEARDFVSKLGNTAKVIYHEKKQTKQYAPKLFKLATLQSAAGKLGYNADKVLEIAQVLYEKKLISYPRTTCEYLSSNMDFISMVKSAMVIPEFLPFIRKISKQDIENATKSNRWINDKALEQAGHYALSPTAQAPDINKLTNDELVIYKLIVRQFIAIFLPPVIQEKTSVITENNGSKFRTSGKVLVSAGYSELFGIQFADLVLPRTIKNGLMVNVDTFEDVAKTTICPKRYTDGELIDALENPLKFLNDPALKKLGKQLTIGTPATRSNIINELMEKGYMERKKGGGKAELIYVTEVGMTIIKNLGDREICRVDMSGIWEEKLDMIRKGNLRLEDFEKEMIEYTNNLVEDIKNATNMEQLPNSGSGFSSNFSGGQNNSKFESITTCPECGKEILKGKGYFCAGYKTGCKVNFPLVLCDAKINKTDVKALVAGKTIEKKMTKGNSSWNQKLIYSKAKKGMEFIK